MNGTESTMSRSQVFLEGDVKEFVGTSDQVTKIRNHIEILGQNSSINVLIRGETGSGKEVVAYLIHARSDRRD